MLTVIVGFDRSGKNKTRSPLAGNRYSVMPSTDVTFSACAYADDIQRNRQRSSCSGAIDFLRLLAMALPFGGAPTVHPLRHRRRSSAAATVWRFMGTSGFGYYKLPMNCGGTVRRKEL